MGVIFTCLEVMGMDISTMVLMLVVVVVEDKKGRGDGGWDDDLSVRLGLDFIGVMKGGGSPLRGGRGREGEAPFLGGGSGLERRRPPVLG
jgi:hypothetical protein